MNGKRYTNETESAVVRLLMTVICIIAVIMVTVYFIGAQFRPEKEAPQNGEDISDNAGTPVEDESGQGAADRTESGNTEPEEDTDFKVYISFSTPNDPVGKPDGDTSGDNQADDGPGTKPDEPGVPNTLPEPDVPDEDIMPERPGFTAPADDDAYVPGSIPVMTNHEHRWRRPTCIDPYVCSVCGWTKGEARGHNWMDATCTVPATCRVCGETEGEPAGHEWKPATCQNPETCKHCGEERGEVADHSWKDATCTKPSRCSVCGLESGEALGHKWKDATCTDPETCKRCGKTRGEAAGHKWKAATTKSPKKCTVCGLTKGDRLPDAIKVAAFSYTNEELDMLARLIYREAGSNSDGGMRAVATVVLNRVRSPYFGSTIKAVINAPGQFYGSLDGINAPEECYRIAKDCLSGNLYDSEILYFKSASTGKRWGSRKYCFSVGGNNFYS